MINLPSFNFYLPSNNFLHIAIASYVNMYFNFEIFLQMSLFIKQANLVSLQQKQLKC